MTGRHQATALSREVSQHSPSLNKRPWSGTRVCAYMPGLIGSRAVCGVRMLGRWSMSDMSTNVDRST